MENGELLLQGLEIDVQYVSFEQNEDNDGADYQFWDKIRCVVGG